MRACHCLPAAGEDLGRGQSRRSGRRQAVSLRPGRRHCLPAAGTELLGFVQVAGRQQASRGTPSALLLFLLAAIATPARAESKIPPIFQQVRIEQRLNQQVPGDLEFRDEEGKTVRLGDYFGAKPTVLVLAYYRCPKLCGLVLNGLRASLDELEFNVDDQFQVLTVSFDPRETPELAAKKKEVYLRMYDRPGAEHGWHFLTGDPEPIRRLCEAVGFYYAYDPQTDQFAHASAVMILTPEGRISKYFYGVKYPARDMRLGLVEAAAEKIGSPVDQVLLYCFHYDPQAGKYTANVLFLVRLGGAAMVVALAAFGVVMWRRDARKTQGKPGEGL